MSVAVGAGQMAVGGLMRRRWISAHPGDSIVEALQLMRLARLRHLPVVADGILRGLLSYPALVAAAAAGRASRVEQVMTPETPTAEAATPVAEAAARMVRSASGCLPVVEDGPAGPRLVGLVVESDLLRLAYEGGEASGRA